MSFLAKFEEFHAAASSTLGGLANFGPDDYQEPLRLFLNDLDQNPVYNSVGRQSLSETIVGLLAGRLMLQQGLIENPAAIQTALSKPIFIVGMARSGTTVLHRVLTEDPATQSLPFWLANAPMPRPPRESWASNPVFQQIRHGLESSELINEQTRAIHPVFADQADECRWVLDQTFWSSTQSLTTATPNYKDWFLSADSEYAYRYHKTLLQLVGLNDSRRWVLKDPSHMNGIDALLAIYPDACIVQTHREPVECMRSIANLAVQPRLHRESNFDLDEYGRSTVDFWSRALIKMESVRKQHDPERFIDFHISEIRDDIVGCIARIYDHFKLPVTDQALHAWQRRLATDPNVGHSQTHQPPEYGISESYVNESVGEYYQRYLQVCDQARVTQKNSGK